MWVLHSLARHISAHAELPDGLWLLAHEMQLIVVDGAGPGAHSKGSVVMARPEDPEPADLAVLVQTALDALQDLVTTTRRQGWPRESGRLAATASIEGDVLRCGYLAPGEDIRNPTSLSVVFPPLPLGTPPGATAHIAG
jgi:hypothetical protein